MKEANKAPPGLQPLGAVSSSQAGTARQLWPSPLREPALPTPAFREDGGIPARSSGGPAACLQSRSPVDSPGTSSMTNAPHRALRKGPDLFPPPSIENCMAFMSGPSRAPTLETSQFSPCSVYFLGLFNCFLEVCSQPTAIFEMWHGDLSLGD